MSEIPWLGFIVALLGGGAMGALIKVFYDYRQGRLQAIGQRLKIFPLFHHQNSPDSLAVVVSVTHEGSTTEYRNLFVADLAVTNRGNKDYDDFEFGVSLHDGQCVHVAWEDPDLHHNLSLVEPVSPSTPKAGVKFRVKPFNRTDTYSLRLYLTSGRKGQEPEIPTLTSPYPIRFIDDSGRRTRRSLLQYAWLLVPLIVPSLIYVTYKFSYYLAGRNSNPAPVAMSNASTHSSENAIRFSSRTPFPEQLDRILPGMKMSQARLAFPRGRMTTSGYIVEIDSGGPFSQIAFSDIEGGEDPVIELVILVFRDDDSKRFVRVAAMEKFFNFPHRTELLGVRLIWPEINGFCLTLDEAYKVTRTSNCNLKDGTD